MTPLQSLPRQLPMLWLIAAAVALLLMFAAFFEIDQGVRAQGQVIADSRTQVIQAVDGGIVTDLYVREGDHVKAGQLLAELESDRAQAGQTQAKAELASKHIALVRTKAELEGRTPDFGLEYQIWPNFVAAQLGVWQQRKQSLDEELQVQQEAMQLAQEELRMSHELFRNGDISQSELMRAQRGVIEVKARISAVRNKYQQEARIEVAKLEDEIGVSRLKLDERQNILSHTELRAPMDGVVKFVRITTTGGVLKPGDELMQISPTDDEMLVELKINPSDVTQLRVGLPVALRFDAFDASLFGKVHGHLNYISPDTLNEQGPNGQPQIYYRAQVKLDWSTPSYRSNDRIEPQDIKPGLTATADVLTGYRTVLYYFAKPVIKAFSGALMQR